MTGTQDGLILPLSIWVTRHLFAESACGCVHVTRAEPLRGMGDDAGVGGFRLIGAGLASLMVAPSKRCRMSRARIRESPRDWLRA
jgi:hypothetical protein